MEREWTTLAETPIGCGIEADGKVNIKLIWGRLCHYTCSSYTAGTWLFAVRVSVFSLFLPFGKSSFLFRRRLIHHRTQKISACRLEWCNAINCMRLLLLVLLFVVVVAATFANFRYCNGTVRILCVRSFWHPFWRLIRNIYMNETSKKFGGSFFIHFYTSRNVVEYLLLFVVRVTKAGKIRKLDFKMIRIAR